MNYAALPQLVLSSILDKLDDYAQAACAAVCRDWLQVIRSRNQVLRVVMRPSYRAVPARAIGSGEELRDVLGRFPAIADLRIAGEEMFSLELPPLPKLHALSLESYSLTVLERHSQSQSQWLLLQHLTSLSYVQFREFRGKEKELLLGLPLLQDLSITCTSGDIHDLLSEMPELPALKSFSLTSSGAIQRLNTTYHWMRNLTRLQLRCVPKRRYMYFGLDRASEAILGSCSRVQHLSISMSVCTRGIILKAAGLKCLRSLQLHVDKVETLETPEEEAAWVQLTDKLTALCITEVGGLQSFFETDGDRLSMIRGLPSGLEVLRLPKASAYAESSGDIRAASLTHLVGLKQLSLDLFALSPVEPLTALRALTKLQIGFEIDGDADEETRRARVLGAFPQLRELVLNLRRRDSAMQRRIHAALLSGISQSSAEVNLGIGLHGCHSDVRFTRFLGTLGERVTVLRISSPDGFYGAPHPKGGGWAFSKQGGCKLPRLRKLQLRFYDRADFMQWLGPLREERNCSMPHLRFVCLLFSGNLCYDSTDRSAVKTEDMTAAIRAAFPSVTELCVHYEVRHEPLSLCQNCTANRMSKHNVMDGF